MRRHRDDLAASSAKKGQNKDIKLAKALPGDKKGDAIATVETTKWDSPELPPTEKDITAYLNPSFEEYVDDLAMIAHTFGAVARARGMSKVATTAGVKGEGQYRARSGDGNPEFSTVLKVANAAGARLRAA